MGLLGRVEDRVVRGMRGQDRRLGREEKDLEWEEVKKAIRKIKEGKAMGKDGVPGEAWKYGGVEMEKCIWEVCKRVWRGEGWPKQWIEGEIIPIVKKGEGEKVENYRGVTVMPTLYKVYASTLAERLTEEVEEKGIIPGNQAGFRRGMGKMDQIYALNYLINRQLGRGKGMMALFIDLKAAFDSVDRRRLVSAMKERGVREGLVERVQEVLRETKSRVRIGRQLGEEFWTARGVRQVSTQSDAV